MDVPFPWRLFASTIAPAPVHFSHLCESCARPLQKRPRAVWYGVGEIYHFVPLYAATYARAESRGVVMRMHRMV